MLFDQCFITFAFRTLVLRQALPVFNQLHNIWSLLYCSLNNSFIIQPLSCTKAEIDSSIFLYPQHLQRYLGLKKRAFSNKSANDNVRLFCENLKDIFGNQIPQEIVKYGKEKPKVNRLSEIKPNNVSPIYTFFLTIKLLLYHFFYLMTF